MIIVKKVDFAVMHEFANTVRTMGFWRRLLFLVAPQRIFKLI